MTNEQYQEWFKRFTTLPPDQFENSKIPELSDKDREILATEKWKEVPYVVADKK